MKDVILRLLGRRQAYRRLFLADPSTPTRDGAIVLADLKRFCYADRSTSMVNPVSRAVDPIASAQAEGRREVWLRIVKQLHLDDRTLTQLSED